MSMVPRQPLAFLGNRISELENALLTFKVSNGFSGRDPDTGNPLETFTVVTVRAYLKQTKPPITEQMPGANPSTIYLKGRAIAPKILPPGIKPQAVAEAKVGELQGKFTLSAAVQSAADGVSEQLGSVITGYLQI